MDPDTLAALAYDAVHLLTHAMRQTGSVDPERVSEALRATVEWLGVTGSVTFTDRGELIRRSIGMVAVRNGRFGWLQGIEIEEGK